MIDVICVLPDDRHQMMYNDAPPIPERIPFASGFTYLRIVQTVIAQFANHHFFIGNSIARIAETLKIYLGLMDNRLTVAIDEPEKIRKRLLGQDSIGIVPEYLSLHRAEHIFDSHIDDVMHLYHFGKAQREICKLASWKELPCIRPASAL